MSQSSFEVIRSFNVFVFGDSKAGKTTLINRIIDSRFTRHAMKTTQCNYFRKVYNEPISFKNTQIKFWDTKGSSLLDLNNSNDESFYKYAHLAIICINVKDSCSLTNLAKWIKYIQEFSECEILAVLTQIEVRSWQFGLEDLDLKLKEAKLDEIYYVSSESGRGVEDLEKSVLEKISIRYRQNDMLNRYDGRFSLNNTTQQILKVNDKVYKSKTCC